MIISYYINCIGYSLFQKRFHVLNQRNLIKICIVPLHSHSDHTFSKKSDIKILFRLPLKNWQHAQSICIGSRKNVSYDKFSSALDTHSIHLFF